MESAATALQVRFETAVLDQEPLHVSGCEGKHYILFDKLSYCYFLFSIIPWSWRCEEKAKGKSCLRLGYSKKV